MDLDDPTDLPPELIEEPEEELSDEEAEAKTKSLGARVQEMNVMEKVKLARFGNGEARGILVRDRNKIVATAATRNIALGVKNFPEKGKLGMFRIAQRPPSRYHRGFSRTNEFAVSQQ